MGEFYLIGFESHTRKHMTLGPYGAGEITAPARGKATILNALTEDGAYPHLQPEVYRVEGARDAQHAWHLLEPKLPKKQRRG